MSSLTATLTGKDSVTRIKSTKQEERKMKGDKVVMTGGTGFILSHVAERTKIISPIKVRFQFHENRIVFAARRIAFFLLVATHESFSSSVIVSSAIYSSVLQEEWN